MKGAYTASTVVRAQIIFVEEKCEWFIDFGVIKIPIDEFDIAILLSVVRV